jgi:hypothetical protein
MEFRLTYQLLLTLPFLIVGMLYGWRRGWREEAITAVGLLGALLFFGNTRLAESLGSLVNRIVQAFALFFSTIFGGEVATRELVTPGNQDFFRLAGFVVVVLMAYLVGGALGQRAALSHGGRLLGSVLGSLNVFLIASQAFGYVQRFLPSAFERESTIRITPEQDANVLRGYLPSIFALLLILLLVIVFLRLPKIRQ